MLKLTLIVFILNSVMPQHEVKPFVSTVRTYASYVGVDLKVKTKRVRDKRCSKYEYWHDHIDQYVCLSMRYYKPKHLGREQRKRTFVMFIRPGYKHYGLGETRYGGGLAIFCATQPKGFNQFAIVAYRSEQPFVSALTGAHELMHLWCADHDRSDEKNLMYPSFSDAEVNAWGGMYLSEYSKQQVVEGLKVLQR